ncbi:cytidylyltransferase domain-containing protein [Endothiovibrio diazotrophicus]
MVAPVVAVVQARMGSSRLPNKMMLWLHGLPVVEWVWRRVSAARRVDRVVFALPDRAADDLLAAHLERCGATTFRGSEADVLGRYHGAATAFGAATVVRICADNPLICGSEIDRLVELFEGGDYDYAYNHIPRGNRYPDGLGAEIASMAVLDRLHREATAPEHREHVFNRLWADAGRFRIGTCDPSDAALAHPELKLDLDTIDDYARLLRLEVRPESTAHEVVAAALAQRES